MHLLVVDDDPLMLELARRVLRGAGYEVDCVLNAEAALGAMRLAKPSLVVLDARMPGMDGFGMLQTMRAEHDWSNIPVVMMTGLRARADVLRARDLGASGYVAKPFDSANLVHQVRSCLERHGSSLWPDRSQGGAPDTSGTWLL